MDSQNEENELVSQTTVSQKRTSRGVTFMKKLPVEWNMRGQPLNNKGGNTLVSYIGVLVREVSSWTDVRLNSIIDRIREDITATFDVGEEHKTDVDKCLRDADDNVIRKYPTKYANLIDEAD
ncbi:hypothetical protein Lal_00009270 [Lupinus albus]|nr:hypothetical protein Lal_00009270 [Lupinus albus]